VTNLILGGSNGYLKMQSVTERLCNNNSKQTFTSKHIHDAWNLRWLYLCSRFKSNDVQWLVTSIL